MKVSSYLRHGCMVVEVVEVGRAVAGQWPGKEPGCFTTRGSAASGVLRIPLLGTSSGPVLLKLSDISEA